MAPQPVNYIGVDLEDYAQPSFCSFDKTYYGIEEDLANLKSVQEEELERPSIRSVELLEIIEDAYRKNNLTGQRFLNEDSIFKII